MKACVAQIKHELRMAFALCSSAVRQHSGAFGLRGYDVTQSSVQEVSPRCARPHQRVPVVRALPVQLLHALTVP